ncbi:MAG TPA: protein-glutamate O-methyltransferase CheR [Firmicutes bacterium]|nr:protein-glutamate O-methyltransferase CheR [Bacillota bacterium]
MTQSWSYGDFVQKLYLLTGLDLGSYKDRQMERRIRQLMARKDHNFASLYSELTNNKTEREQFLNYVTINTSEFFRDKHVYDYLSGHVFPDLLSSYRNLNIWSAGCSTGEEPYTLSILAHELKVGAQVKILASDIDQCALDKANLGRYHFRQLEKLPLYLKNKYFEHEHEYFYIRERYKQVVKFHRQNLLASLDSTIPEMQLILCRNVFIYFKIEIQERLIKQFSRQLTCGGYFVTGCVEMINNPLKFGLERKIPAVYKKVSTSAI